MKKLLTAIVIMLMLMFTGCEPDKQPVSNSGVGMAQAVVNTQSSGLTIEQENIKKRLELENMPGAIKHLYVISAYSGQVILYSTVKGKITSSAKRLTPTTVTENGASYAMEVHIANRKYYTEEVIQDDGTYSSSIPYIYWWDVRGQYHQHFIEGGQILHISDKPMPVKNIVINIELTKGE